ncbi:Hypothetical protein, putative [Bodo saltans]|uniref:Adenylate kinase isoenzyme 6 homolog n=1 Tax=Bodo saltans TaxID=75058 RepID=A0A0S4JFJ5_BODSA|nr:Hypothetical protein, putative [Bodo saltans]|eukprot:CUG88740.1 Hypothetical protein, putative [Bodo saltans]
MASPRAPNILITGTPATGKTSMAQLIAQELQLKHIEVGKVIKEERFYTSFDEELDTRIIEEDDEDRLLDFLEPKMMEGGVVVDYHSCEFFPERWFQIVVVLRTSTEVLFERLSGRGYGDAKRDENMEAEIIGVVEEEARSSYGEDVVVCRENNNLDEMAATIDFVRELYEQKSNHQ